MTRSLTKTQARSNDFEDVQIESDHEDSLAQDTRGSSSPRTLSSIYPRQFVVYMADNDGEDDQDTKDSHYNNSANLELADAIKQNNLEIKLLERALSTPTIK